MSSSTSSVSDERSLKDSFVCLLPSTTRWGFFDRKPLEASNRLCLRLHNILSARMEAFASACEVEWEWSVTLVAIKKRNAPRKYLESRFFIERKKKVFPSIISTEIVFLFISFNLLAIRRKEKVLGQSSRGLSTLDSTCKSSQSFVDFALVLFATSWSRERWLSLCLLTRAALIISESSSRIENVLISSCSVVVYNL